METKKYVLVLMRNKQHSYTSQFQFNMHWNIHTALTNWKIGQNVTHTLD